MTPAGPTPEQGTRVLLIDDEADLLEILAFELRAQGLVVDTAECGEAGIALASGKKFDIAITDLKMPGIGGVATVEGLRALDPTLPVIVASGYCTAELLEACRQKGAVDFLAKPYELSTLLSSAQRAIAQGRKEGPPVV